MGHITCQAYGYLSMKKQKTVYPPTMLSPDYTPYKTLRLERLNMYTEIKNEWGAR